MATRNSNPGIIRRDFLRTSSTIAGGVFVGGTLRRNAHAIEPVRRNGSAKFKFSVAGYSYRDLFKSGKLKLSDFIDDCAAMGCEGTELTSYYFPSKVTAELPRGLKQHCFRLGLDVSGTAVGNDFCHGPGKQRDAQLAHVKRWAEYAEILSAPVIRIFSGKAKKGMTVAEARKLAVSGIEECCEFSGRHGVYLALENHGGLTSTPEGMLELVRAVRSPWFGVNLDSGNFHGKDVYADLAKIAPYAVNVQIKVAVRPANGKKQPSDFNRLAKMLVDAGYRGYIVLEYEEAGDARKQCAKYIDQLREAFS